MVAVLVSEMKEAKLKKMPDAGEEEIAATVNSDETGNTDNGCEK